MGFIMPHTIADFDASSTTASYVATVSFDSTAYEYWSQIEDSKLDRNSASAAVAGAATDKSVNADISLAA
ncbi:MAG TPA: hypothetical protein VLC97_07890 [Rhodanobacteraceae bacterium]|nr:hypothetical protein [Rhodanobacteraceae bacterium]